MHCNYRSCFLLLIVALAVQANPQLAPATVPTLIVARSADAFVESIGVNGLGGPYVTPLPPDGKPYTPEQAKLYNTVPVDPHYLMGVRYHRIEGGKFNPAPFVRLYDDYGIRINCLVQWAFRDLTDPANLAKCMNVLHSYPPDMIASIEGNNEANFWRMSGMPDWRATVARATVNQNALYPAVKNDPQLQKIPVLCFTIIPVNIGQGSEHQYAGKTTSAFDLETMHSYQFDSGASSVELRRTAAGVIEACGTISDSVVPTGQPFRPIISTETGCTSNTITAEATETRMDPMTLANNFAMGIPRTYLYGSWGNKPWDICCHPAGEAITEMTAMFGEAKWDKAAHAWSYPRFQPGALEYGFRPLPPSKPGVPVNVHQLLLQKSDGTFYLLLWNDVAIWNHKNETLYNYPPVPVDVSLSGQSRVDSGVSLDLQTDGSFKASPLHLDTVDGDQLFHVNVSDRLTIIELKPAVSQLMTQKPLAAFTHVCATQLVTDEATNSEGTTSVCLEHFSPVKTYRLALSFVQSTHDSSGKPFDVFVQGNKVAESANMPAAVPIECYATADWRGRFFVQVTAAPGGPRCLEKVQVFDSADGG